MIPVLRRLLLALLLLGIATAASAQTTSTSSSSSSSTSSSSSSSTSSTTLPPGVIVGSGGGFVAFALQNGNFCPTTSNGQWVDTGNYREGWLDVTGITTGTVVVQGSNAAKLPTNATAGYTIKSITADEHGVTAIDTGEASAVLRELPRWVKASITVCTTDAGAGITVILFARRGATQ